jgi:methylamine dehydrogenase accessory protein MauD
MREKTIRFLLFDASCALCSDLAGDVERASGGALVTKSLYAPDAIELLKRARPKYKFEPTLIEQKGARVRAYTGMAMRAQMVTFLNPIQLLKIARLVQQAGVPLFGSFETPEPSEPVAETKPVTAEPAAEPTTGDTKNPELPTGFRLTPDGPPIGTQTPVPAVTTTKNVTLALDSDPERNTLLLFLSTHCPFCHDVAHALTEFVEDAPERIIVVFGAVEPDKLQEFLGKHPLGQIPIVVSPETRAAFGVTGVPYGFALDRHGTVRGKGVVNNNDHLDSLAKTFYVSVEAFKQALASRQEDKVVVS